MNPRIGIIGLGRFCSNYHIPHLLQIENVTLPAVCDVSKDRLVRRDAGLASCTEYSNHRELIGSGVDGVVVSTTNSTHFEICYEAILKGVHVLVDKPTTMTAEETRELRDLSQKKQTLFVTAFTRHFFGSVEYVRRLVASGHVGEVKQITVLQCRMPHGKEKPVDGGILLARAVHIVDICPWLMGAPVASVEARIDYDDRGWETTVDMHLEFGEGTPVRFVCIPDSDVYHDEIAVYAKNSIFRIEQQQLHQRGAFGETVAGGTPSSGRDWMKVTDLPVMGNATSYFVDLIRKGGAQPDFPLADRYSADGLIALRVLEAAVQSSESGERVHL